VINSGLSDLYKSELSETSLQIWFLFKSVRIVRNFITDMVSVQISLRWMLKNQALHKSLETGQLKMVKESGKGQAKKKLLDRFKL